MKNPTPLLFPLEPLAPEPVQVEWTEEIESSLAALLLQVLEVTEDGEADDDEA